MAATVVRLEFDIERKLKVKHQYMRDAVRTSGKSIGELLNDPFGGYPYLLQALVNGGAAKAISLDQASGLIDTYLEKHDSIDGLTKAMVTVLSGYLHIEQTPTEDEDDEADVKGAVPNAATPEGPGHSGD